MYEGVSVFVRVCERAKLATHTHTHLYALNDEGHFVVVLPLIYWALQIGRPLGTRNLALAEAHPAAALEIYQ